jgi:hypothetical protein
MWQRTLFMAYANIGRVAFRQSDLAAALNAFAQAGKIVAAG